MRCSSAAERARLAGYIVNKFRGDPRLFDGGIAAIGERTGLPASASCRVSPSAHLLPAEDTMALAIPYPPDCWSDAGFGAGRSGEGRRIKIAVPLLPHIANFDDLDPLRAEPASS